MTFRIATSQTYEAGKTEQTEPAPVCIVVIAYSIRVIAVCVHVIGSHIV